MDPCVSQMLQGNQGIVSSAFPGIESDKAKEKGSNQAENVEQ